MTCGIYLIVCVSNGAHYVGQSQNIEQRWKKHRVLLSAERPQTNRLMHRSARKYGLAALAFTVIDSCAVADLTAREQFWIDHYRACGARMANAVGPADNPTRGALLSAERRAQISAARKGQGMPAIRGARNPSCRPAWRAWMTGDRNPARRDDARAKMSANNASRRPVMDVATGERWPTMSACAAALGVSVAAVHAAATKKNPTVAGRTLERARA